MADSCPTGPRFVDTHLSSKILPGSRDRYKKCVQKFLSFIIKFRLRFDNFAELDDLLVEYKYMENPTKSEFDGCIAGVEHVLPAAKGKLPWAHAVANAWSVVHDTRHTVPMNEGMAIFLGCHLASRGKARLGAGLVLQEALGLRPRELLQLRAKDVMLPEDRGEPLHMPAVFGLGMRHGTKAKRAQTVCLGNPTKVALLRWLRAGLAEDDLLIGVSYAGYRAALQEVCVATGLQEIGFTPHSPRAGFASDCIAAGLGYSRTRELGRWVSETSLRTYVDLAASSSIKVNLKLRHLNDAVAYCAKHILCFFFGSSQFLHKAADIHVGHPLASTDAATGLQKATGRLLCDAYGSVLDTGVADEEEVESEHASAKHVTFDEEVDVVSTVGPSQDRGRGRGRSHSGGRSRGVR